MFFKQQPDLEKQKDAILAMAEHVLGDRERKLEAEKKQIAARWARLNECANFINAALRDAGNEHLAAVIESKLRGTWSAAES